MADGVDRVVDDVRRYRVATQELIAGLGSRTASSDEDVVKLVGGMTMTDKMHQSQSARKSRGLTDRREAVEAARRDLRGSVAAAPVAEGRSTAEIAERFGVTRQLASRIIHGSEESGPPT